ncbi:peptidase domain-containing ABC transporter [Candidatus Methylobacter oryzae]|uniref:ATP-binding cassette domain-containing protein n=1 Tax=Candidatus Methylobacter oryzae TaxID=2497749 RepID=A0ABY3CAA5_9GAMM|nr:ATP-binding cassette domain-containing protein [Candidatus Methylobacter oryzae]TRW94996.1 ATP-binding cassette domain-containing protein [Candidatus Methylobacter oryzae]
MFAFRRTSYGATKSATHSLNPFLDIIRSADLQRAIPILVLVAFLYNILGLVLPMTILQIMDRVVVNQSMETLTVLVAGVVVSLMLEEILRQLNGTVTSWLGARFEHLESVKMFEKFLRVPLRYLQHEEPSVHVERIAAAAKVAEFYSGQVLLVLLDIPFMLIFLAMIYIIGDWVVWVPVALLGIFTYLIAKIAPWLNRMVENGRLATERRNNFLIEVLSGIYTVKTMAMEAQMERRHERLQATNAEASQAMVFANAMVGAMGMLISQLMIVSVIFAGALGVLWGQMTPGGLAACMLLSVRTLQPLRRGLTTWAKYQSFLIARKSLQEVADMPEINDQDKPPLPRISEEIELRQVTLERKGREPVFNNLSLKVAAGECIVIEGICGSGKTALMTLLSGVHQPDAGEVLVDGRPLNSFATDSIHREIGFMPQAGTLITGTILENMTMFDHGLNEPALKIAAQLGLDRAVANMKLGYETPVGEGNTEVVTVGMRQTIALVRVLVHKPNVILFDEANGHLDMEGDKLLLEYMKQQKGQCTMVLITHRPSWKRIADRIFTISGGRLIEGEMTDFTLRKAESAVAVDYERPPRLDQPAAVIRQHFQGASDFSLCLAPLLSAIGWEGNIRELMMSMPHVRFWQKKVTTEVDGEIKEVMVSVPSADSNLDISGFCNALSNLGWVANSFSGNLQNLDARLLPCLFVAPDVHAKVILEQLADGRFRCFDGGSACETVHEPDREQGRIYIFKPNEVETTALRSETKFFNKLLGGFKKLIVLAFALTVFNTLFALAPPLFTKSIYERVLPSGDLQMQVYLLLGILLLLGLDFYMRRLRSHIIAYIGGRADYILGTRVFRQIINLPVNSTSNVSVRRQVERIRNFEGLRDFFHGPLATITLDMPANLVILVTIGIINPWTLIVIGAAITLYCLLGWASKSYSARMSTRLSRAASSRIEFINETLTQMHTIRCSGNKDVWLERFRDLSAKTVLAKFHDNQTQARIGGVAQIISSLTGFAVLVVCALGAIYSQIGSGAMIVTMMLVWRLVGPMQSIFLATNSLGRIRSSVSQIENLMRLPLDIDIGAHQAIRPAFQGELNFMRVSFRYLNDADPALLGISFSLKPGQFAVIAGASGTGKSTILKLIARLYTPQAGTIRLDGVDIRQLAATDLRTRISYMPQNCDIFYGTITQNLRLVHPAATDAELAWAAKMAGLDTEVELMPEGFNTRISASQLSQLPKGLLIRLALARAMLMPSPITLLDQPGDALDEAGEEALLRCIAWLRGRSTLLMISHRPAHMRLADTVIYLERGSIAAMGPFDTIKERLNLGGM